MKNLQINQYEIDKILSNIDDNLSFKCFSKIDEGGYSDIYRYQDKIIKIGKTRASLKIADNSRILLPYFKGYVSDTYIEVTDYCEPKKVELEDLYLIYEELRDQNVMWLDPSNKNIGILTEDLAKKQQEKRKNIINLDIFENPSIKNNSLKAGDYVIIDLDHMVFDNDLANIYRLKNILNEEMEQRLDYFERRYAIYKSLKKKR